MHPMNITTTTTTTENTPPRRTPWGGADDREEIAPGIWQVSTPSHGGIWLAPFRRKAVPAAFAEANGGRVWFEEDCAWALAFITHHADLLESAKMKDCRYVLRGLEQCHLTARRWYPHEYMKAGFGVVSEEDSFILRNERFHRENAGKMVSIWAVGIDGNKVKIGAKRATATRGKTEGEEVEFIVARDEYENATRKGLPYVVKATDKQADESGVAE